MLPIQPMLDHFGVSHDEVGGVAVEFGGLSESALRAILAKAEAIDKAIAHMSASPDLLAGTPVRRVGIFRPVDLDITPDAPIDAMRRGERELYPE